MAEVAGLALGSVALVPLIKNVRHLYDSIKDAPKALQQYQVSTSRLLDTLEVIHTVSKTYNVFPENSRPWLAFQGYLADINNSCMELENLLKKKMKAEGKQIGTCKRVLWALLGRDEKAKDLMNKIDGTARSLHLLFSAMTSIFNSTMHDTHKAQLTISANTWITSGENITSILAEVATIKTILEEVRADSLLRGRKKRLTAFISKTQSTGRQSRVILHSKYEIKVRLSSALLGYDFHINIGLDIGARSLCPTFGLYCQRVIPEGDLQYYYVENHMFEEFRDLVVQGRASIHDLYHPKYKYPSTSSDKTSQPRSLRDPKYTKAIPKQCDDCDFATVECPNCGEIPLELQGEEFSESTSDEDDQLPIPDSTVHLVSSDPQIEGLGVKLLAWSKSYIQPFGLSGILITVLSAVVSYLLYKLKQSEDLRHSMLVYSEGLGPEE
ncbi:hypothetical protein TWF679_005645 [Orbilia oligospora]|uniref:Fungal N-terminal domain-containing protein n=1 Tax=Orbilia oligospora TaxID=2813651 RepID=A0A8H8VBI1_ORBOL|nr:hypothetical protein TWF679_005645 [Orbilia oligospora]